MARHVALVRFALGFFLLLCLAPRAAAQDCAVLELAGAGETITRNFVVNLTSLLASEIDDRGSCDRLESYEASRFAEGCTGDEACLATIADDDGLDYVLAGAVLHEGERVVLRLRLFDADRGRFVEIMQREIPSEPDRMSREVALFAETFHGISHPGEKSAPRTDDEAQAVELISEEELLAEPELFGDGEAVDGPVMDGERGEDLDDVLATLETDTLEQLAEAEAETTVDSGSGTGAAAGVDPVDLRDGPPPPLPSATADRPTPAALRATAGAAHYQRPLVEVGLGIDLHLGKALWLDAEVDGWFGSTGDDGGATERQSFVLTPLAVGLRIGDMAPRFAPHVSLSAAFVGTHVDQDTGRVQVAPGARLGGGLSFRLGQRVRLQIDGTVGLTHAPELGAAVGDDSFRDTAVAVAIRAGLVTLP